jgi:gluconolactonase
VGTQDGGLLFAQEQPNRISKLNQNGKFSVYLTNGQGPGAVSIDPQGRLLAAERTCTDPGGKPEQCTEPTAISALTPTRKILADSFAGQGLGRVNDLIADKKGGVYFTNGGAFYANSSGQVSNIGENLRTNGLMLSGDEKTLYVTNGTVIVAFDVQPDGSVSNQRDFGKLEAGGASDGMAIDAAGRLYISTNPGVRCSARRENISA